MIDKYGVDESFLKTITLLYVEDDEDMRLSIQKRFGDKFAKFTVVSDAEAGLEEFAREHYDLVMTDYFLPKMNGLAFTREIRAIKSNTPVIMVTGHIDMEFLVAAINMGVTQFVAKPVQFKILNNAIMNAVERVVIDNLRRKAKEQEFELLQLKEDRNAFHQEFAMRKERHLIHNDLYMRYFSADKKDFSTDGWNIDIFYESKELVSGDIYSCRRLDDDNAAVIIIDAMGKGVSAAVTSTIAVVVFNYFVDLSMAEGITDLRLVLDRFLRFMKNNLLDDEILCLTLARFNFKEEKMWYAAFSMPRICLETSDGSVMTVPSNNLPIMKFVDDINVNCVDLKGITKILIYSDGLVESSTKDGGIYSPFVEEDFRHSPFIKNFESCVRRRVAEFDDDTSIFFIRRPFTDVFYRREIEVETSFEGIERLEDFFNSNMAVCDLDNTSHECFGAAFSEIAMNAYEHGNLDIDGNLKHRYIEENIYEEKLLEAEVGCDKKIVSRFICCKNGQYRYIVISVRDEGKGYPLNMFGNNVSVSTKFSGRGLKIISHYTDDFFFSEDRREIFIVKLFGDNAI